MIVRNVLTCPEVADALDVFNDAKDTIKWLRSVKDLDNADQIEKIITKLESRLRLQYEAWCREKERFSLYTNLE